MTATTNRKRLTDEGVRRLKPPKEKQAVYWDGIVDRLMLVVSYGSAKTWRVLYYVNAKPRSHKLGRFPQMRVKQARIEARNFLEDPDAVLARTKVGTFQEVAEDFIKRHVDKQGLRSKPEIVRCLTKYVYPKWKDRPFLEIKRRNVADLLDDIEDAHGAHQADAVLAIISKLTRWYQARSDDYISPVVAGMRRAPASSGRKRILEDEEIKLLWQACDKAGTYGAFVKTLLLTAQRSGKVVTIKWSDIVNGEWHIPSEPREKGHAGSLRLPQAVLNIIEDQTRIEGNPYVFFAGRRKDRPLNTWSPRKAEVDAKMLALRQADDPKAEPLAHWTLHDLRRTARSLMARAKVAPHIAERVLGHAIPGVEGVYDRYSYADEKADALARLAGLVELIISPPEGNVVPLVAPAS